MSSQHQYGLLPRNLQGEESHEATAKRPGLVRMNRVFNALDIHMPDPEPLMRSPAKGREQGGRGKPGLRIQR